ncbi:probable ATP-dependent RNA helicase DDX20 [Acyrthosiphon pisum]|uniref:ATP-dependent RNA helicase n=1 Tax=Acyrthosiphon pisum TaxID=7029 RepID=A0A8R1W1K6_ACYPI|nr:probable ATP-dependent RNA helicase DDX20 [Acyrthosiphon pisum]|eukprot:XP_001943847.2 PREDICTED: probable ATP-dependent RNA helicase DDX20 [Acyrthosiphon pisum]
MPVSEYSKDSDRTTDVQTHDQTPFDAIITGHPLILKGLSDCGFTNASPIQVAALPTIIAGHDTIVEAKNGTGKTLTFVIPTLMRLKLEQVHLQTIILAPTREIAVQIQQCFKKVGQHLPELKCEYFIGGTPVDVDKEKAKCCQIAVGSPGRIKHLINEHVLKCSEVKSFILDEVDRLVTDKSFTKDVRLIDAKLPKLKQTIVVSASIDKNDMSVFDEFMTEYIVVKGAEEDMNALQDPSKFLLGIKQYVACVKAVSTNIILLPAKNVRLLNILQNLQYTQCIIFTNYMTRVEAVCNMLRDHNYKADYIRGDQDQSIRLELVDRLTSFKSKILVATDLIARGIDSSNVDLVINMDCPNDWATYLHRIGRAGRFGNKGNAFTILDDDKELKTFKNIINSIESIKVKMLPIAITKPILEYADNELEDLNLTTEPEISPIQETGNNVIEDNLAKYSESDSNSSPNVIESNINSISEECQPCPERKSVYGYGVSEKESLQKLCKVVKETEKKLIEDNMVDKRLLTEDRSFVLFDPEPFLEDTDQYPEYSPDELLEIITKYDSDFEKYEADKNRMLKNTVLQTVSENEHSNTNQVCEENDFTNLSNITDKKINDIHTDQQLQSQHDAQINCEDKKQFVNEVCSESNFSSNSNNSVDDTKIDTNNSQRLRFTDIYSLFEIPDFSLLKPAQHDSEVAHSTDVGESDVSTSIICEKGSDDEELLEEESCGEEEEYSEEGDEEEDNCDEEESCEEEESCDEEEYCDAEESCVTEESCDEEEYHVKQENRYEEHSDGKKEYEEEINLEAENKIFDEDITNKNGSYDDHLDNRGIYFVKHNNKSKQKSLCNNIQEYNIPKREEEIIENNDQQIVDYEILNDWYSQWKQQMSRIQTFVRMSK